MTRPHIDKSPFGLSFIIANISVFLISILIGLAIEVIYLKRRRKHSSMSFTVEVEIEGNKVTVDVPDRVEADRLATRFNLLHPTIYLKRDNVLMGIGKRIETEKKSISSKT